MRGFRFLLTSCNKYDNVKYHEVYLNTGAEHMLPFYVSERYTSEIRGLFKKHYRPGNRKGGGEKSLVVISGGTGLAPVRSTLNYCYENTDQIKDLYLIAGFKDAGAVLFNEEREK